MSCGHLGAFLLLGLLVGAANAQENDTPAIEKVQKILVTDEIEDFVVNAGTPQRVGKDKINLYKYTDVNRVLRQTSGVYVREEDGQGLRPNIGLRGTNPDRSKKVVLMEDGILVGPAPYAAPAAYYTPHMNHIEGLEVYKGFAAVPYGPNSVGGAINYQSLGIPNTFSPSVEGSFGSFNTSNIKMAVGDHGSAGGYIIQVSRLSSDGFKKLDGGGDVGFLKNDVLMKGRLNLASGEGFNQYLEGKLGYSDEDSHETYVGLSLDDFNASPYRRYSSTALDEMKWKHTQAQLEHVLQFSTASQVKTTLYRNDFHRRWFRLDSFSGTNVNSIFDILNNPYAAANNTYYNIISGQEDSATDITGGGNLVIAGNDRTFYSQGLQTKWTGSFTNVPWFNPGVRHEVEMGLRLHMDQIRRNHTADKYAMTSGRMIHTIDPTTTTAINSNYAEALTFNFLENMHVGNFVLTALGRAEKVKFKYTDSLGGPSTVSNRSDTIFAPGAGVLYKFSELFSVKGSVNRGVSIAGLDDRGIEAKEESVNYELGLKYVSQDATRQAEVILFYNDYSNITGTCTASTGGCSTVQLDKQFNGGGAAIQGLEGRVGQNLYYRKFTFPLMLNLTLIDAEFKNSFNSTNAEWGIGTVSKGDPLPYVPKVQYTFTVGTVYKKFTQELAFIYQRQAYDQSVAVERREIPAYGIVDWTARYSLTKQMQLFGRADNLLDKNYLVSLRPYGARSGKPQSFMVGLSYAF